MRRADVVLPLHKSLPYQHEGQRMAERQNTAGIYRRGMEFPKSGGKWRAAEANTLQWRRVRPIVKTVALIAASRLRHHQ
jgi:hypothetical protein